MREHKQLASPLLNHAEVLPHELAPRLTLKRKSALGQFMTPASLARFMASLFSDSTLQTCHLLDSGAGIGALSAAFLQRWDLVWRRAGSPSVSPRSGLPGPSRT